MDHLIWKQGLTNNLTEVNQGVDKAKDLMTEAGNVIDRVNDALFDVDERVVTREQLTDLDVYLHRLLYNAPNSLAAKLQDLDRTLKSLFASQRQKQRR